jgi:hypothetical protein
MYRLWSGGSKKREKIRSAYKLYLEIPKPIKKTILTDGDRGGVVGADENGVVKGLDVPANHHRLQKS